VPGRIAAGRGGTVASPGATATRPVIVHAFNPRALLLCGPRRAPRRGARRRGHPVRLRLSGARSSLRFLPQQLVNRTGRSRWRNRAAAALSDLLVVVSQSLGERLLQLEWHIGRQAARRPYGVDVEGFQSHSRSVRGRGPAFVGGVRRRRAHRQRRPACRAEGLSLADRRVCQALAEEPRLRLVLVGDGPLRASSEGRVAALGISQRVRFFGHVDDVRGVLRAFDLFVQTSKFEPYGVAVLEAKAAGRPVIATDVNEMRDDS